MAHKRERWWKASFAEVGCEVLEEGKFRVRGAFA